jgi:hypothetical protein
MAVTNWPFVQTASLPNINNEKTLKLFFSPPHNSCRHLCHPSSPPPLPSMMTPPRCRPTTPVPWRCLATTATLPPPTILRCSQAAATAAAAKLPAMLPRYRQAATATVVAFVFIVVVVTVVIVISLAVAAAAFVDC